jgi:hypothetical protein
MLTLLLLIACAPKTGDDTSTTCDESNEACGPGTCEGEGGEMLPGSDCLSCHSSGAAKEVEDAPPLTAAGTAFVDLDGTAPLTGATVRITDAGGFILELTTNSVGNFYTNEPLTFPINAEVEVDGTVQAMGTSVDVGGCSSCHACAGSAGGKLTGP